MHSRALAQHHQCARARLRQQAFEYLQRLSAAKRSFPARLQVELLTLLLRKAHSAAGPQRPLDRNRLTRARTSLTPSFAVVRVRLLVAIRDRVIAGTKIAEHRGGRAEVADEVERFAGKHLI